MTFNSSLFLSKLKVLIKFLLFREDEPKHHVMQSIPIPLVMYLPIIIIVSGILVFSTIQYGLLVFLTVYVGFSIAVLEIVHLLYDR